MNGENVNIDDRLLKKSEVAEKLSCHTRTVDRLAKRGQLITKPICLNADALVVVDAVRDCLKGGLSGS